MNAPLIRLATFFALLLLGLAGALFPATAEATETPDDLIVTRHFSGLWEQPEHENQGFTLHVVHQYSGENTAVAFWFTYGQDREPYWLLGTGPVIGNRIELNLHRLSDVGFLQPDDPEVDPESLVGTAVMQFESCQRGTVTYATDLPGMTSGSVEIEQIGWILNTHCSGGISDNMPVDAMHGEQWLDLVPVREGIQGSGHVRFETIPNHMAFEISTDGLADGNYAVFVGGYDRGELAVHGGHGELTFSSPQEDGHRLLNFDPRGHLIELRDGQGAVLSSLDARMAQDDHSGYRGNHDHGGYGGEYDCDRHGRGMMHGSGDCVADGEFIELEIDLANAGVLPDARGEAEWEMNAHRVMFSVDVQDVPAGDYVLKVGGDPVGMIEAVELYDGRVLGHLGFRDPERYGTEHLDFDPRGQLIEVLQGNTLILSAEFPSE